MCQVLQPHCKACNDNGADDAADITTAPKCLKLLYRQGHCSLCAAYTQPVTADTFQTAAATVLRKAKSAVIYGTGTLVS